MITARGMKAFLFAATLGVALMGYADLASAKVLRWDLQNVTFDDGDTVSGFFLFNADAPLNPQGYSSGLVSWDIVIGPQTSCPGTCFPAYRFSSALEPGSGNVYGSQILTLLSKPFLDIDPVGRTGIALRLAFNSGLSDVGGKVAVGGYEDWTYIVCCSRDITSGQVVAVPEASEALFLALGLAALVGFSTRRARRDNRRAAPSKVDESR